MWPKVLILTLFIGISAFADVQDPLDAFENYSSEFKEDQNKTAEELLEEATFLLFDDERPLDARSKLLRVLQLNPKEYRAHMLLAGYYMEEVGHFRLALRYVKQAIALFEEAHGKPPYTEYMPLTQHDHLLYLLSQARLNLDDYQGALNTLNEYNRYGYYRDWYPGSRSWVLMKMGRLDEAIKVARLGVLSGAEPGRLLNMLGILLSMVGQRNESLRIFEEAIDYELALGKQGRPATPLNNAGEVYEEIFDEKQAEQYWLKSLRLPDGCEHVLPSLNLAMLYLDQNKPSDAKKTVDGFERCIAQYPLRNGEEHKAFVHFARGRIALIEGRVDLAIEHFEQTLQKRQWFGKIGTSENDLKSGALMSLSEALTAKLNSEFTYKVKDLSERLYNYLDYAPVYARSLWYMRRARQVYTEDLNSLEDLFIRNTDSMVDYPRFGKLLGGLPNALLEQKIESQLNSDQRLPAKNYYSAYLIENRLAQGESPANVLKELRKLIAELRPNLDETLFIHLNILLLNYLDPDSQEYSQTARLVFIKRPAALKNAGIRIPIRIETNMPGSSKEILQGPFLAASGKTPFTVLLRQNANNVVLEFYLDEIVKPVARVTSDELRQGLNRLIDEVFTG